MCVCVCVCVLKLVYRGVARRVCEFSWRADILGILLLVVALLLSKRCGEYL